VVGVCREQSAAKLDAFSGRMSIITGATDDREVISRAVAGCGGVLTVLVPRGVYGYSTGTAQAVLDLAPPGARLVFSCGWHISRDGQDVYPRRLKWKVAVLGRLGKLARAVDLNELIHEAPAIVGCRTPSALAHAADAGAPAGPSGCRRSRDRKAPDTDQCCLSGQAAAGHRHRESARRARPAPRRPRQLKGVRTDGDHASGIHAARRQPVADAVLQGPR
jgi:hypothetical protein